MDHQDEKTKKQFSFGQRAAVFAPTALATIGLPALLHAPLPLEIAGLVAAYFVAQKSPEIYGAMGEHLPFLPTLAAHERADGEWTILDRLLGRHYPQNQLETPEEEEAYPKDGSEEEEIPPPREGDQSGSLFPLTPHDETLQLGYVLASGQRFDPHFDQFFESGCFISAVQGSGKSILVGRIIEQFGKCGGPSVVFDHKGEYWPVTELPFINGLRAGSASLAAKAGPDVFVLTPESAAAFVKKVQTERKQAIIHLPSYGDNWLERAEIVSAVGRELMRYSRYERENGRTPIPCLVVMDEAQLYIPQDQGLLPPEAQERDTSVVLKTLNNSYYAMVSNGRSNGYCVVFATQSPTFVKKWAIKSCQFRVFMRHTEFNDLNALEKIISPSVAKRDDIEVFGKGIGVAFGLTPRPVVVKFDMKESRDLSDTPKIQRLRQRTPESEPALPIQVRSMQGQQTLDLDTLLLLRDRMDDATFQAFLRQLPLVPESVGSHPDTTAVNRKETSARHPLPSQVQRVSASNMLSIPGGRLVQTQAKKVLSAWNEGDLRDPHEISQFTRLPFHVVQDLLVVLREYGFIDTSEKQTTKQVSRSSSSEERDKRMAEDINLDQAVNVWNRVHPSIRDMEAIFGLNNNQARRLRKMIKNHPHAEQWDNEEKQGE